jgi:hypothetical protein
MELTWEYSLWYWTGYKFYNIWVWLGWGTNLRWLYKYLFWLDLQRYIERSRSVNQTITARCRGPPLRMATIYL